MAWATGVNASELYISAITVMELELGVVRVERRDAARGAALALITTPSTPPRTGSITTARRVSAA